MIVNSVEWRELIIAMWWLLNKLTRKVFMRTLSVFEKHSAGRFIQAAKFFAVTSAIFATAALAAEAATVSWINTAGGAWDTAANWDANRVPKITHRCEPANRVDGSLPFKITRRAEPANRLS